MARTAASWRWRAASKRRSRPANSGEAEPDQRCAAAIWRTSPAEGAAPWALVQTTSGRLAGTGAAGRLIEPLASGAAPQLPELCDTTRGGAPLPWDVISTLWVHTPLPDIVERKE